MSNTETVLPADAFSRRLRELADNPGAVRASSTINRTDYYGNNESWIIDTFRFSGSEVVLLQRIDATGSVRLVLPEEITAAMTRQRSTATGKTRRRGAKRAVETKRSKGLTVGNLEALAAARNAPRKRRKPRRRRVSK